MYVNRGVPSPVPKTPGHFVGYVKRKLPQFCRRLDTVLCIKRALGLRTPRARAETEAKVNSKTEAKDRNPKKHTDDRSRRFPSPSAP